MPRERGPTHARRQPRRLRWFHLELPDPNGNHHLTQFESSALAVSLVFEGEEELVELTRKLGIALSEISADAPGMEPKTEAYQSLPHPIHACPRFAQPGWILFDEGPVYVWIDRNRLRLSILGVPENPGTLPTSYTLGRKAVELAERVEERIATVASRVIREPASPTRIIVSDEQRDRIGQRADRTSRRRRLGN